VENADGTFYSGQDKVHCKNSGTNGGALCVTGYDDYSFYHGSLLYSFSNPGCGPLQAWSRYAHTWSSASITGVSLSYPAGLSISLSSTSNAWQKGSSASNQVTIC